MAEAVKLGLEDLGVSEDQVEVEVIQEGPGSARVRLRVAGGAGTEPGAEVPEEEPVDLDDALDDALDFVDGLMEAMGLEGEVHGEVVDGGIEISVEGADAGVLIGRHGQTLDAMQELLRTVVRKQARARVPVLLDVEGYRDRRRVALEREARAMAQRALEGEEVELDPMPAFERKIVHDTVAGIDGVSSFSEGEEPRRRVVIVPSES